MAQSGRDARRMDEDDVRVRARGSNSRRRTRDRPEFADAEPALVTAVDRGRFSTRLEDGTAVVAVRGADVRRTPVVVGDEVGVVGDLSGAPDTLARIVSLTPRTTLLTRTPDDDETSERPVVANAELLVCVVALADPVPRPRMIDRVLVAAYDGGLEPVLCLTKADLADETALRRAYEPLGVPVEAVDRTSDLTSLLELLTGRSSVFYGHSGVGKSTLVNRLVPGALRSTGAVNDVTGRGRHTSSSAVLLDLPGGGHVIDTPGVRSFGLGRVSLERVLAAFPEFTEAAEHCPALCSHTEPGCALDEAVTSGLATPERLDSLRRLLASRSGDEDS